METLSELASVLPPESFEPGSMPPEDELRKIHAELSEYPDTGTWEEWIARIREYYRRDM